MEPTNQLTPHEVRRLMLSVHQRIRTRLVELLSATRKLPAGPRGLERVLHLTRELARELKEQIALEAKVLVPALRNSDAWGEVRADKLIAQLRSRRKSLRSLRKSIDRDDRTTLRTDIDTYIEARGRGMTRVERDSLSPGVLRDDITGIDVSGG